MRSAHNSTITQPGEHHLWHKFINLQFIAMVFTLYLASLRAWSRKIYVLLFLTLLSWCRCVCVYLSICVCLTENNINLLYIRSHLLFGCVVCVSFFRSVCMFQDPWMMENNQIDGVYLIITAIRLFVEHNKYTGHNLQFILVFSHNRRFLFFRFFVLCFPCKLSVDNSLPKML